MFKIVNQNGRKVSGTRTFSSREDALQASKAFSKDVRVVPVGTGKGPRNRINNDTVYFLEYTVGNKFTRQDRRRLVNSKYQGSEIPWEHLRSLGARKVRLAPENDPFRWIVVPVPGQSEAIPSKIVQTVERSRIAPKSESLPAEERRDSDWRTVDIDGISVDIGRYNGEKNVYMLIRLPDHMHKAFSQYVKDEGFRFNPFGQLRAKGFNMSHYTPDQIASLVKGFIAQYNAQQQAPEPVKVQSFADAF